MQSGAPFPDWIENAPELHADDEFYLEAFARLGTERQQGFGEGPIPITSIFAYVKHYGFNDEEQHDFAEIIMLMDAEYLQEQAAKAKKERAKK